MQIISLKVANYKSLRSVAWEPGQLAVVVGANASGKSNFADFHDFLADIYRHGLEMAVARKGGYENIALRKIRRSKGAISAEVFVEFTKDDIGYPRHLRGRITGFRVAHWFSFRAESRAIRSDFRVEHEEIVIYYQDHTGWHVATHIIRRLDDIEIVKIPILEKKSRQNDYLHRQFRHLGDIDHFFDSKFVPSTDLLLESAGRLVPLLRRLSSILGSMRVFQLSPTQTRAFGVPMPNPEMDRHGANLPAVVDMLQRDPEIWASILDIMRHLLPGLDRIEVSYTHSRQLGLDFHEAGVGRPWNVAEISDGTIHSLALLTTLFDPRISMIVLEEPENSVHTWILRNLMEAAKTAARSKQIVFTTHSRVVVDAVPPKDVWVMWRDEGESSIAPLTALEPDAIDLIEEGDLTTFETLDTGAVPEALPPQPKS